MAEFEASACLSLIMPFTSAPRTAAELAELEASYLPFVGVDAWSGLRVDGPRWRRFAHVLDRRRGAAGAGAWADAMDRLLRAAALDSSALDGMFPANPELTSVVLGSSIAERAQDAAEPGSDPIELLAECHRRALVLASEAAAGGRRVDAHLIAVLQDVITESQVSYTVTTQDGDQVEVELPRRRYKPVSNYLPLPDGELAAFAPAGLVAAEMDRLSSELGSAQFAALHPAVQAAYAHYALIAIHPFADGNGRLSRTVASIFLVRDAGVPLIVFADQWPSYYRALNAATQAGDYQVLVDFIGVCAMSAMDLAANLVARPVPGALAMDLLARHAGPGAGDPTPPAAALDEAACALLQTLAIELREALVSPPPGMRVAVTTSGAGACARSESAYRTPANAGPAVVRFSARARPSQASRSEGTAAQADQDAAADLEFVALVSKVAGDQLPVALREARTGELLEVALDDAYPLVGEPAEIRIRLWVQRLVSEALLRITPAAAPRSGEPDPQAAR
jgi:Fic/DOC family